MSQTLPATSYQFDKAEKRIDWIFSKNAGTSVSSVVQFVEEVNKAYYRHSAELYDERFCDDISRQYRRIFSELDLQKREDVSIVDVGGGIGFSFERFLEAGVRWKDYYFIEPSQEMREEFKRTHANELDRVTILPGKLEDFVEKLQSGGPKIFVINSVVHHIIWLDSFLAELRRCMKAGDVLLICHEPNNRYPKSAFFPLNYAVRCLTTDFLVRRLGVFSSPENRLSEDRWKRVNSDLIRDKVSRGPMKPLLIRRIIDYGVNSKGDWRTLGVPQEYNEGYWTPQDLLTRLGPGFEKRFLRTYRHLGDPGSSRVLDQLNRALEPLFASGGSTFCLATELRGSS